MYAFMGVPTINSTDPVYLKKLFNRASGINRVLIGIESGDDLQSRYVGKNESPREKREAIKKTQYTTKIL